ncbi:hypothetical protein [Nocardia asteroides]|uniref:hypothetical protein n=1 Tax=Nocardia asteroides TaxID=1824 RepID=UPI003421D387
MADISSGMPMTEAEMTVLFKLLQRWCASELDQFDNLIIPTRWGDVYADFSRERPPDHPAEVYRRLPADMFDETL